MLLPVGVVDIEPEVLPLFHVYALPPEALRIIDVPGQTESVPLIDVTGLGSTVIIFTMVSVSQPSSIICVTV